VLSTLGGNEGHTLSFENLNPWMKPQDWIKYAEQIANPETQQEKAYWALLMMIFTVPSLIFSAASAWVDRSGTTGAIISIAIEVISLIVGIGAIAITSYGLGALSLGLSIGGLAYSVAACVGLNRAAVFLGVLSAILGGIAAYCALQTL
jgi:hypothetical protein